PHSRLTAARRQILVHFTRGSQVEVAPQVGILGERLLVGGEDLLPGILVPEPELVDVTREDRVAVDAGMVPQVLWQEDPPLPVELTLVRARDVVVAQADELRIEPPASLQLDLEL